MLPTASMERNESMKLQLQIRLCLRHSKITMVIDWSNSAFVFFSFWLQLKPGFPLIDFGWWLDHISKIRLVSYGFRSQPKMSKMVVTSYICTWRQNIFKNRSPKRDFHRLIYFAFMLTLMSAFHISISFVHSFKLHLYFDYFRSERIGDFFFLHTVVRPFCIFMAFMRVGRVFLCLHHIHFLLTLIRFSWL